MVPTKSENKIIIINILLFYKYYFMFFKKLKINFIFFARNCEICKKPIFWEK